MSAGAENVARRMLSEGFVSRAPLDDRGWAVYIAFLSEVEWEDVVTVVQRLAARGHKHRPKPPEILAELRADLDRPSFPEALQLIYGRGGFVRARNADEAAARVEQAHPVLRSFVRVETLDRLRMLQLEDPVWGGKEMHQLEQRWNQHVVRCESRLLAGQPLDLLEARSQVGPKKLDPLSSIPKPPAVLTEATS